MLFLVVLGGAAVLEVHRALHSSSGKDVGEIKRKEDELKKQLQDLQKELQATKAQRELTAREAAQLSELNQELQHAKEELERQSSSLKEANEDLARKAESLLERQQQLEQSADTLQQENAKLLLQFDRLRIQYEQESSNFHEQLTELKQQVSGALQRFTAGELSAEGLLAFLSGMGVEVRCRPEDLEELPSQLNSARSREERLQLLDKVELKVDDSWVHQLRLSTCPDRAARLLMGASRDGLLTAREPGPSGSAVGALTYPPQPAKKLGTPPVKDKESGTAPKVPLLRLGALSAAAATPRPSAAAGDAARAVQQLAHQLAPAAGPAGAGQDAQHAAGPTVDALRPVQESRTRSLRFLPNTKKSSGISSTSRTPRLELDLSLRENQAPAGLAPINGAHSSSAGSGGGMASLLGHLSGAGASGGSARSQAAGLGVQGMSSGDEEVLGGSRALLSR